MMRFKSQHIIELSKLSLNFEALRKIAQSSEICFMIKANAYGHGLLQIAQFAYHNFNVKEFGLASLGEAILLRNSFPDMLSELYVFSDVLLFDDNLREAYRNKRIIPVISNEDHLDILLSQEEFKHFPLVLKFDTGMNRLGLDDSEKNLEKIIKKIKQSGRKSIYHLMTHFACSSLSMTKNSKNQSQLERFSKLKKSFADVGIKIERSSISNSGAIEQGEGLKETHIRPGLMLYGPSAMIDQYKYLSNWNMQNISRLETYIIQTFKVKKGTPVGYGATPIPYDGVIAIMALGYGDGISSHYKNAKIYFEGYEGIIFGRVNMDMTQLLFKEEVFKKLKVGSKIIVFDHGALGFRKFCNEVKTIPYEVFLNISSRVSKTYLD